MIGDIFVNNGADDPDYYELTEAGREKCNRYLDEMKAKRKEILDAKIDTVDETNLPTVDEMFEDLLSFGIDINGEIFDCFGVTDNYNADTTLTLTLDEDFIGRKN